MNKIYLAIATVFLLFASFIFVSAQKDNKKIYQISPPQPAYVFDEYNPNDVSAEDEKQRLELFASRVKDTPDTSGYVRIYRGANDYKFDLQNRKANIDSYLVILSKTYKIEFLKPYAIIGGFRHESSIEMIIEPPKAERLFPSSNVSLLDVKYYDNATLEKGTIQKTGRELLDMLIKRVEPLYSAAARATNTSGEVGVLTKIDEKGKVIEAKSFVGHALLRATCEQAVKQWQFKPEIVNKVPVKVVGITMCDFKLVENETINY